MKKIFLFIFVFLFGLNLFSQETLSENSQYKVDESLIFSKFIVSSLQEKAELVKMTEINQVSQLFFEQALVFAVEHKNLIESYPAYYPLILASIQKLNENSSEKTDDLLLNVYKDFNDYNLRLAVLNAFSLIKPLVSFVAGTWREIKSQDLKISS